METVGQACSEEEIDQVRRAAAGRPPLHPPPHPLCTLSVPPLAPPTCTPSMCAPPHLLLYVHTFYVRAASAHRRLRATSFAHRLPNSTS